MKTLVAILFLTSCSSNAQKLKFTRVDKLSIIDTNIVADKKLISKEENYMVENYKDDSTSLRLIDSFVNKNKDIALNKYSNYNLAFYKKSDQTNIENISKNKRIIDRYSNEHDLLYRYFWYQGKFIMRYKYKDGEIIEPKNDIILKDMPPK
jgi:hypothetical protein